MMKINFLTIAWFDWKGIDILQIETIWWSGSLLYICKGHGRWGFDLFFLRQFLATLQEEIFEEDD